MQPQSDNVLSTMEPDLPAGVMPEQGDTRAETGQAQDRTASPANTALACPSYPHPLLCVPKSIPRFAESAPAFPAASEDEWTAILAAADNQHQADNDSPADNTCEFADYSGHETRFDLPDPVKLESRGVTSHARNGENRPEGSPGQSEFWRNQTIYKNTVAAKLREAGMTELADKLEYCHSRFTVCQCDNCGKVRQFPNRCDSGLCPECQPRLANERRKSVEWWTHQIEQPKHVTLTVKNIPEISKGHVLQVKDWFSRLRRRAFARSWVGGFYSIEVTNEGRGWHIHIHALVNARFIDGGELARQWAEVTNQMGRIVKVKDCRDRTYLGEVTKYAVKGSQLASWPAPDIAAFVRAFEGVRTFGVFGSLYKVRTEYAAFIKELHDHKPTCECGCSSAKYYTEQEWQARRPSARTPQKNPAPEAAATTADLFPGQAQSAANSAAVRN